MNIKISKEIVSLKRDAFWHNCLTLQTYRINGKIIRNKFVYLKQLSTQNIIFNIFLIKTAIISLKICFILVLKSKLSYLVTFTFRILIEYNDSRNEGLII